MATRAVSDVGTWNGLGGSRSEYGILLTVACISAVHFDAELAYGRAKKTCSS